jgi:undecaprenyl-diphosphatase
LGVAVVGYVVMAALLLGGALLITRVLSPGPVVTWDNSVNRWFVGIRTSTLDSASAIGSALGGAPVIIGTALVSTIALGIARRWKAIAFLVTGLVIESAAFLTAATLVTRPRPPVVKLETSPPTSSFPSGHTAAAIVLYISLAIIVGTLTSSHVLRAIAWILAVVLPVFVGASRMYRGMHHPTDIMGGCVLGIGALLFALLTVRINGAVRGRAREKDARDRVLHPRGRQAPAAAVSR